MRSAANGIAAVAFAATAGAGSLQSMALGAGLAAASLATMASGPHAIWAAGIGAAVVVAGTLVGVIQRLRAEASKPSGFALERISDIKQLDLAEQEYTRRRLERDRLAAELASRPTMIPLGRGGGARASRTAELKAELDKATALAAAALEQVSDLRSDREGRCCHHRDITLEGLQARNAAQEAADVPVWLKRRPSRWASATWSSSTQSG
jgi:hypothetical protein